MNIRFTVHYKTQWGQTLHLLLTTSSIDGLEQQQDYSMRCNEKSEWSVLAEVAHEFDVISYRYVVYDQEASRNFEYGDKRMLRLPENKQTMHVFDNWRGPYGDSPFSTSIFSECFFKRLPVEKPIFASNGSIQLRLNC